MTNYILRRLLLLPLTLLAIILVNFVILNLAPGDPVTRVDVGATGEATRSVSGEESSGAQHYLQFREHYGLTLPILWNLWPEIKKIEVHNALEKLAFEREKMSVRDYHELEIRWGDRARYIIPLLLSEAADRTQEAELRRVACNLLIRGGTKLGHAGITLSDEERKENRQIAASNLWLAKLRVKNDDTDEQIQAKAATLAAFFAVHPPPNYSFGDKMRVFFLETRFARYFHKVLTLDFGALRNDSNKTVISEVAKRIKYSLTLALTPMLLTFFLCQFFGMIMALNQNQWPDLSLNLFFLVLFAIPVFVVAPFLIEKLALHHKVPFTQIPIPLGGFHSHEEIYNSLTSRGRLFDILLHLVLPLIAIIYGTLAVQARLARTAVLEVLRQEFVKAARARGLPRHIILFKHVGRNAAITIVTALAASLGVVLGGSLIVETVFEINGFGRFFFDAIQNRDYNVVLFSAFAGSLLTLVGYLVADIAYTFLDPRISLE